MMAAVLDGGSYGLSLYSLPPLLTGAAMLALGLRVLILERRSLVSRLFFHMCLPITVWLITFGWLYSASTPQSALFWAKAGYLGVPFIPPSLYHFSSGFLGKLEERRVLIRSFWWIAAGFSVAILSTDALVRDVKLFFWGYYPQYGWLGVLFVPFFAGVLLLALLDLWQEYHRDPPGKRRGRIRTVLIACAVAYVAGIDFIAKYGVAVYPAGHLAMLAFLLIVAWTVRRYRFDLTPSLAAQQIVDTIADALIVCDTDGRISVTNDAVESIFGFKRDELTGKSIESLTDPDATLASSERLRQAFRAGMIRDQERVFRTKEGEPVEVSISASPVDIDGAYGGSVVIARDIRERKKGELKLRNTISLLQSTLESLRQSEERYRHLFERSLAGVYRATREGRLLDCNDAFAAIVGLRKGELLATNFNELHTRPGERRALIEMLDSARNISNIEVSLKRPDGTEISVMESLSLIEEPSGPPVVQGTVVDITDRKNAEQQLAFHAYHDVLTALPNRLLFGDRLEVAIARAARDGLSLAVLFLDLDQFKMVNDTLGHTAGDELLIIIGERVQSLVRQADTVARIGGDEFAVLLTDIHESGDAARVAAKIMKLVAEPLNLGPREIFLTTSIGIAIYPVDGESGETLLRNADTALFRAKDLGRNVYQLSSQELSRSAFERLSLEAQMPHALMRGEFTVHYQPVVSVSNRSILGMEALVRWQHPERGILHPSSFISLAEGSHLILPLGEWVLRTACRQAVAWRADGLSDIRIAVNLSIRQLQQPDFGATVERILAETTLPAHALELEVTESVMARDHEMAITILHQLREIGVRVSIDDFGTGYSSLSYLSRFPVTTVKIDQSFVRGVARDTRNAAIVGAVLAIARSLGLDVIAEGVESEDDLLALRARRCNEMQGFLFSHPKPPDEFSHGRGVHFPDLADKIPLDAGS